MNIYRTDMIQNDYQEVQFSTTTVNGIIRKNTFGQHDFHADFESDVDSTSNKKCFHSQGNIF